MQQLQKDVLFLLGFHTIPVLGPKRLTKLINYFPTLEQAWSASRNELIAAGLEEHAVEKIIHIRPSIDRDEVYENIIKHQVHVCTIFDDDYPERLKTIPIPPPVLYYKGVFPSENDVHALSVVGTRKMTPYGKQVIASIVADCAARGCMILSGLALGVDGAAHKAALSVNARTVAALAHGLNTVQPTTHARLAEEILEQGGALISEFPIGTPSLKQHFPQRNRIIAGLSQGTLIVEADIGSGTLITAHYALEYGREVFSVPGSIFSQQSRGTLQLLKQGAIPVMSSDDIFEAFEIAAPMQQEALPLPSLTEDEACIMKVLSFTATHIDDMIKQTKLDVQKIHSILVAMELKGYIQDIGGYHYIKRKP